MGTRPSPAFCTLSVSFADSSPKGGARTCLSLWERWHGEAVTERVGAGSVVIVVPFNLLSLAYACQFT